MLPVEVRDHTTLPDTKLSHSDLGISSLYERIRSMVLTQSVVLSVNVVGHSSIQYL